MCLLLYLHGLEAVAVYLAIRHEYYVTKRDVI